MEWIHLACWEMKYLDKSESEAKCHLCLQCSLQELKSISVYELWSVVKGREGQQNGWISEMPCLTCWVGLIHSGSGRIRRARESRPPVPQEAQITTHYGHAKQFISSCTYWDLKSTHRAGLVESLWSCLSHVCVWARQLRCQERNLLANLNTLLKLAELVSQPFIMLAGAGLMGSGLRETQHTRWRDAH